MQSKVFFVELNEQEKQSKLRLLKNSSALLWIPKDYPNSFTSDIEIESTNKNILLLSDELDHLGDDKLLLRFEVRGAIYFAAVKQIATHQLQLVGELFRYEKRESERLLTYPHRKVYLLVEYTGSDNLAKNNILDIHSKDQGEERLISMYNRLHKQKSELELKLRVLDISAAGIAILAGKQEVSILVNQEFSSTRIIFDDCTYAVVVEKLLYSVEYLDVLTRKAGLYKVGLKCQLPDDLKVAIEKYLADAAERLDVMNDFEQFLLSRL